MDIQSTKYLWYAIFVLSVICLAALFVLIGGWFALTGVGQLVDRSWVSQAIVAVFGISLAVNARTFWMLNRQWFQLTIGLKPDPSTSSLRLQATGLLGLHAARLQHIYRGQVDGAISQDVSLSVIRSRLYGEQWIVRCSAQLLLTLGLIGTVLGLAQSLDGLGATILSAATSSESISASGGSETTVGLNRALGGMATAFATTLYGAVLGGVFLKLLVNCTHYLSDELVNEIELITEMELVPLLRAQPAQMSTLT